MNDLVDPHYRGAGVDFDIAHRGGFELLHRAFENESGLLRELLVTRIFRHK